MREGRDSSRIVHRGKFTGASVGCGMKTVFMRCIASGPQDGQGEQVRKYW